MRFARTADYALIREVLTHPALYPWIGDDYSPAAAEFSPNADPRIWYVTVHDGAELLGLFVFLAQSAVLWEVHCALLPAAWGRRSAAALRGSLEWIWSRTTCRRIVAAVPAYNRLACSLARRAGLERYGVNPGAWQKGGVLHDLELYGISKG